MHVSCKVVQCRDATMDSYVSVVPIPRERVAPDTYGSRLRSRCSQLTYISEYFKQSEPQGESVFAEDPYDPLKCNANRKCPPGKRCVDGTCYKRLDCPQIGMPMMKSHCKMNLVPDKRNCLKPKITCDKENLS
ncbi:hypothetical protein KIN20_036440 [Parelaphostrongylus tenuis]|uniref:Uncharacterized protein n=1 Tax=Parelaphostrongylus tenuis TaxID=148309 RepID=A0AAD5RCM5_PARTN|nr:hypothetical protein KIN20_036440 [Parelaphostrongylus tenuis]